MLRQSFGYWSYHLCWLLAAVVGVCVATHDSRRTGVPRGRAVVAASVLAVTIFVGSKLLFLVEYMLFPVDATVPWEQASWSEILQHGFRIPGGILLMAPVLPLLCQRLRLPTLQFADTILPGVAVALVFIRIGCFLNGCCFGRVSALPWAVTFPPGTGVYSWQAGRGLIPPDAASTLPVHPLQLYFALLGVLLYFLARRWQEKKQFPGQVWANFYMVFFGGTFLLELLRPQPLRLNLILSAAVVLATAVSVSRLRTSSAAAVQATS